MKMGQAFAFALFAPLVAMASEKAKDFIIPKVSMTVSLSGAARAACEKEKQVIYANILYDANFGVGDPQTVVHSEILEFPCSGGRATAPSVNFSEVLRRSKHPRRSLAVFSGLEFYGVFNSSKEGRFNLIWCDVRPPAILGTNLGPSSGEIVVRAKCVLQIERVN